MNRLPIDFREVRAVKGRKNARRGGSVLELALILPIFLMLTLGMIDAGRAVFRYHVLNQAACQGARRAIVHGALATTEGVWGPATNGPYLANNATGSVLIKSGSHDSLAGMLVGCDLSITNITVDWTQSGGTTTSNAAGAAVKVTVASPYHPFMPFLSGGTLSASSTMQIVH